MSGKLYLKNRLPIILLNLLGVLALSLFLLAAGNDIQTVLLILGVWILVLTLYLAACYISRKKRLDMLLEMAGQLEERYDPRGHAGAGPGGGAGILSAPEDG